MKLKFVVCATLLAGLPLQQMVVAAPKISNSEQWKLDNALRIAAHKGDSVQAMSFLARGARINAPGDSMSFSFSGTTAMHLAVESGNESLVAYFLKKVATSTLAADGIALR